MSDGNEEQDDKAKETTLLVLVVDRSGSMQSIKEDMEGGIAALLAEQGKEKGSCLVTLAQFDTEYELVADGVPVAELEPYRLVPRGGTALLDAIGRTIAHVKDQVDHLGTPTDPTTSSWRSSPTAWRTPAGSGATCRSWTR